MCHEILVSRESFVQPRIGFGKEIFAVTLAQVDGGVAGCYLEPELGFRQELWRSDGDGAPLAAVAFVVCSRVAQARGLGHSVSDE